MKLNFTLTLSLIICSIAANAQDLTGIWRGYFSSSTGLYRDDTRTEMYKYEIQIDQQANNALQGVTYSYKSTVFYGKASLQGLYTVQTKNLILKETGMIDLKISDKSEPCLMTCYLEYTKIGKLEVLQGTFISINARDKSDCGSGKVYLERVKETDFELEEFLVKKPGLRGKTGKRDEVVKTIVSKKPDSNNKSNNNSKPSATTKQQPASSKSSQAAKTTTPQKSTTSPLTRNNTQQKPPVRTTTTQQQKTSQPPKTTNNLTTNKPKTTTKTTTPANNKPKANNNQTSIQKQSAPPPVSTPPQQVTVQRAIDTPITNRKDPPVPTFRTPIPKVLTERVNNLVKTIVTNEKVILIDIYDNGTIDDDTISLYHNNKLVISNGKLSNTSLKFKIDCSEQQRHELILVAENLGEIPPNTALMVITAGKKRYEIFLTSNEQRNAKVVIEYKE